MFESMTSVMSDAAEAVADANTDPDLWESLKRASTQPVVIAWFALGLECVVEGSIAVRISNHNANRVSSTTA